jgi:transposase
MVDRVEWFEELAYEATGIYHRAFEQALTSLPLVQINPLRARRFAQATGTLAKTDRIDAGVLARMAATFQPDVRSIKSPELAGLAELMNARDGLVRDRTALKNREKNLLLPLLKRQVKARLEQIARHIDAIDKQAQALSWRAICSRAASITVSPRAKPCPRELPDPMRPNRQCGPRLSMSSRIRRIATGCSFAPSALRVHRPNSHSPTSSTILTG